MDDVRLVGAARGAVGRPVMIRALVRFSDGRIDSLKFGDWKEVSQFVDNNSIYSMSIIFGERGK